jgi:hypothetical protein
MTVSAQADQVLMQNGDHYNGRILSVTTNALVLQSDVLGTVTVPRDKATVIALGPVTATNFSQPAAPAAVASGAPSVMQTNVNPDLSAQFFRLGMQTNLIQQVQGRFLSAAGPEANAKFSRMMDDLGSGRMTVNDLRAQAKSAADQLRSLKKESGRDDDGTIDMYLSILDDFIKESSSSSPETTNTAGNLPGPAPEKADN